MKFVAMLALLAWSAVSSFGQAPPFYTAYIYTKEFHPPALVKGIPYSATQTNIVPKAGWKDPLIMTARVFRDTAGRTRREAQYPGDPQSSFKVVEIVDRMAGYHYVLDEQRRIAHRAPLPDPTRLVEFGNAAEDGVATPPPSAEKRTEPLRRGQSVSEPPTSLGRRTIDGLEVEGTQQIVRYPAGDAEFDAPFTGVWEVWISVELKVAVLRTISRQPVGIPNEMRLTDIVREEPPASLFQIPPGYKIVDETGRFTVEGKR
jgi:hypothetical protein